MVIKPEEAKKLCCPPAMSEVMAPKCIADRCMAWRTCGEDGEGFCGMAGKPSNVILTEGLAAARLLQDLKDGKLDGGAQ